MMATLAFNVLIYLSPVLGFIWKLVTADQVNGFDIKWNTRLKGVKVNAHIIKKPLNWFFTVLELTDFYIDF